MENEKIYIAYGSNLNKKQMGRRCPNAKILGSHILKDYKLEFRGVANIISSKDAETPVGLWLITDECEKALDKYEGYPNLYRKEYINIMIDNKVVEAMAYVMNHGDISIPTSYYYNVIEKGYKDFKLNTMTLKKALAESIKKHKT